MERDSLETHREEKEYAVSLLRIVFTDNTESELITKAGILQDDRYDRGRWLTIEELTALAINYYKAKNGEPLTLEEAKWQWPPKRPSAVYD